MGRPACLLAAMFLSIVSRIASAGVVINLETTVAAQHEPAGAGSASSPEGAPRSHFHADLPLEMLIDSDRLRIVFEDSVTIYRGDLNKVWRLTGSWHAYTEETPETMKQARATMDNFRREAQRFAQSMSPEERKQFKIETLLSEKVQQVTYQKLDKVENIGQWSCVAYRKLVDGVEDSELCIAKLSDLGLSRDDLKALVDYRSFIGQMSDPAASMNQTWSNGPFDLDEIRNAIGFDGIPVEIISHSMDGAVIIRSTIKTIDHKYLQPAEFGIPLGYAPMQYPRNLFTVSYRDRPARSLSKSK